MCQLHAYQLILCCLPQPALARGRAALLGPSHFKEMPLSCPCAWTTLVGKSLEVTTLLARTGIWLSFISTTNRPLQFGEDLAQIGKKVPAGGTQAWWDGSSSSGFVDLGLGLLHHRVLLWGAWAVGLGTSVRCIGKGCEKPTCFA